MNKIQLLKRIVNLNEPYFLEKDSDEFVLILELIKEKYLQDDRFYVTPTEIGKEASKFDTFSQYKNSTFINKIKYNFDTTYYYNKTISVPTIVKCLYCEDGKHKRVGDGKIVKCPVCDGVGSTSTNGSIIEEPRKCFLSSIKITKEDWIDISYIFDDENGEHINNYITAYEDIEECIKNKSKYIAGYTT